MKTSPRPKRSKGTWYVSFEPKERLRGSSRPLRAADTFRTEQEAKAFAGTKLADSLKTRARSTRTCRNERSARRNCSIGSRSQTIKCPSPPSGSGAGAFGTGGWESAGQRGKASAALPLRG